MQCDRCGEEFAPSAGHVLPCPDLAMNCSAFVCESCFIKESADIKAALKKMSDYHWTRLQEIEERLQELG